jgi:hypothetical protein
MFNIDRREVDKEVVERYIEMLEQDLTVPAERIGTIVELLQDGSKLAMEEAKRMCEEELDRIADAGLCSMGKYMPTADNLIQNALVELAKDGDRVVCIKDLMENMAEHTAKDAQDPFIVGMYVGRILTTIEFNAMQMAAMAEAQQMIGSMGLGNIAEMGMELMKGKMPDISGLCKTSKADGLLDRLKNLGQGEGKVDPDDN